ncbi:MULTISPECIES: MarR family winged helix-turn-helix transcriptional regulator [Cohaesibacter]|uniref:MarR family winged helix-turn-helix transcriptional regulator n=1 Tax=Cohaesibacter TaxID=655352 RepID=UPI000DEB6A08|nr:MULTISPECIES: MarR family transcriptional regulator [Cohaesibacter]TLP46146.1 MarR family transcriptional regulator [Cohaesibacter sp. CAU 1516]
MTPNEEIRLILMSIRKIARALDIHSRYLNKESGLTLPQLIVLHCVRDLGAPSGSAIAKAVDLSPPTVLGILDKLTAKGLIERQRLENNRRVVVSRLTEQGEALLADSPSPLGEQFSSRYFALNEEERRKLIDSLETFADLTKSEKLDEIAKLVSSTVPTSQL